MRTNPNFFLVRPLLVAAPISLLMWVGIIVALRPLFS